MHTEPCTVCGLPLVLDDDETGGYHASKNTCIKALNIELISLRARLADKEVECERLGEEAAAMWKWRDKAAEMEKGWEDCYQMWRGRAEAAEAALAAAKAEGLEMAARIADDLHLRTLNDAWEVAYKRDIAAAIRKAAQDLKPK